MTHNIQNYLSFKDRNYVQDSDKKNISGDNSGSMFLLFRFINNNNNDVYSQG